MNPCPILLSASLGLSDARIPFQSEQSQIAKKWSNFVSKKGIEHFMQPEREFACSRDHLSPFFCKWEMELFLHFQTRESVCLSVTFRVQISKQAKKAFNCLMHFSWSLQFGTIMGDLYQESKVLRMKIVDWCIHKNCNSLCQTDCIIKLEEVHNFFLHFAIANFTAE